MPLSSGGIRAGNLNRRCDIQAPTKNPNGTIGWTTLYAAIPCAAQSLTASEAPHQLGPSNIQSTMLSIRYRPGITTQMRVIFRGRVLELESVINVDDANVMLTLMCREAAKGV